MKTTKCQLQNSEGQEELREVETMSSPNIQFKALLVGIVIGAIAGIVVYITVRALGIKEAASGAIIGGIVGAISVTLSRRKPLHRAN